MGNAAPVDEVSPRKSSVLIVEDEVLIRMTLADALRERGLTVIEAATAEEALSILGSSLAVDLVMTDIDLPGALDGLAVVDWIRANRPDVKTIIGTGRLDPPSPDRADGFFSKPYDVKAIFTRMEELLAGRTP